MTPEMNTVEIAYNDAPDDLRNKLKRAIMELTDKQTEYVLKKLSTLSKGEQNG